MKIAIYPGSFNPYHRGHESVVNRALCVFDKVILAIGQNPDKPNTGAIDALKQKLAHGINNGCIEVISFEGFLADYVQKQNENVRNIHAVIRGIRNSNDLIAEQTQEYWNQDLKIGIPTIYFNSPRELVHISSSALRAVEKLSGN